MFYNHYYNDHNDYNYNYNYNYNDNVADNVIMSIIIRRQKKTMFYQGYYRSFAVLQETSFTCSCGILHVTPPFTPLHFLPLLVYHRFLLLLKK